MSRHIKRRKLLIFPGIGIISATLAGLPAVADETAQVTADSGRNSIFDTISVTGGISNDSTYSDFTVGLEYERLLSDSIGIGAAVEYTAGDMDSLLIAAPVTWRHDKWKLQAAPGFADSYRGRDFVTRLSAGYEFDADDWIITPIAKLDFIDEKEVLMLGVTIGTEF